MLKFEAQLARRWCCVSTSSGEQRKSASHTHSSGISQAPSHLTLSLSPRRKYGIARRQAENIFHPVTNLRHMNRRIRNIDPDAVTSKLFRDSQCLQSESSHLALYLRPSAVFINHHDLVHLAFRAGSTDIVPAERQHLHILPNHCKAK